jgi:hypothetical protein
MKNIKIIISLMALLVLSACEKNFLDRKPLDEVGALDYFKSPKDLETYLNQFYTNASFPIVANHGSDFNSDNAVATNFNSTLAGTRTLDNAGAISFGRVRSINYFFDNYKLDGAIGIKCVRKEFFGPETVGRGRGIRLF